MFGFGRKMYLTLLREVLLPPRWCAAGKLSTQPVGLGRTNTLVEQVRRRRINRLVVGSSPTGGAFLRTRLNGAGFFMHEVGRCITPTS